MGETGDKETNLKQSATVESNETDQLLNNDEIHKSISLDKKNEALVQQIENEEIVSEEIDEKTDACEPKTKLRVAEREVKPKKIPVGGIKIPGFFTKSKDKNKTDEIGTENELLSKDIQRNIGSDCTEVRKKCFFDNIKYRFDNMFTKNAKNSETNENKLDVEKIGEENKLNDSKSKQSLLETMKLSTLGNLIPKRLKKSNQNDIELGDGLNNKAGLASMETLDDSQKDNSNGDALNKDTNISCAKDGRKMDTIMLKEAEKAAEAEQDRPKRTVLERVQNYRCSMGGILLFLSLVMFILIFALSGKLASKAAPIRDGKYVEAVTGCGNVEGLLEDSSFAFRGIPYAIPPLLDNRWRHAELIDNIDYCWNGTFKAHNATPTCWQIYSNNSLDGIEDCLTLDIITPHVRYDNPLPVIVLIGADSYTGDSPGKLRPSARYARARDVVFVRPNFRLGIFGFLSLKQLSESTHPPTSGNYALSDIIVALKWISMNIVHFGGDPNSVTLFGYKTGATLVTALMSSNKTKGLYNRVWISSGAVKFPGKSLSESEKDNAQYLNKINCSDTECLRRKDDEDLLEATPDEWRYVATDLPFPSESVDSQHEWLVLDGDILSQHPSDVWKSSDFRQPKVVIGTTIHESHSNTLFEKYTNWTSAQVRKHVAESQIGAKGLTEEVFKRYNDTYQGLVSIISDIRTVCPLLQLHRALPQSTFYVVTQTGGPINIADDKADIEAILGRYEPITVEQRRYMSSIQQVFYYFVSHGSVPQTDGRKKILDIGQDPLLKENWAVCDFWIANDFVPRYAKIG
ncbi:neurotactin isoform X2 [Culicoides brevitarsis]|uniref:neurotactin isoform X2 n=1 Tax=Culicoides brevitarsis TaxID=469753 RepID=UPI00307B78AB